MSNSAPYRPIPSWLRYLFAATSGLGAVLWVISTAFAAPQKLGILVILGPVVVGVLLWLAKRTERQKRPRGRVLLAVDGVCMAELRQFGKFSTWSMFVISFSLSIIIIVGLATVIVSGLSQPVFPWQDLSEVSMLLCLLVGSLGGTVIPWRDDSGWTPSPLYVTESGLCHFVNFHPWERIRQILIRRCDDGFLLVIKQSDPDSIAGTRLEFTLPPEASIEEIKRIAIERKISCDIEACPTKKSRADAPATTDAGG